MLKSEQCLKAQLPSFSIVIGYHNLITDKPHRAKKMH